MNWHKLIGSCCLAFIWLAFTWDSCSVHSEFLLNPHLPQLHLYRSATGYFICSLCSSSMSYGAFPLHVTVRFGTVHFWGFFHWVVQYLVPGTFFSTTSVEVQSEPYHYQNVKWKLCWSPFFFFFFAISLSSRVIPSSGNIKYSWHRIAMHWQ